MRIVSPTTFLLPTLAGATVSNIVSPNDIANALVAKGANVPMNNNNTATASKASLVRPNANYVYSPMAIDLSHENLVVTVPEIKDGRSYVYPFYDLYGNNIGSIGSAIGSHAGDYLIRPAKLREPGLSHDERGNASCENQYRGIIDLPTTYGSMELRILLRNNKSDLESVHRYQNETKVRIIPRHSGSPLAPRLSAATFGNGSLSSVAFVPPYELSYANATALLGLLAKLAPYNPPENPEYIPSVNAFLAGAGISQGEYSPGSGFNSTAVNEIIAKNLSQVAVPSLEYWNNFGEDWWAYKSYSAGNFHDSYLIRSIIANTGYLELTYKQALYPEYINPSLSNTSGDLSLAANESLIFTFSGRPAAQFWSVTAYNAENYLIQNSLGRYNLGCTSESLTYSNGSKVYPTGQHNDQYFINVDMPQPPFQVLVQPADKAPPANWTGNWLPCQAGGGKFSVNFRTYGPSPSMINGSYAYPVVTKQGLLQ